MSSLDLRNNAIQTAGAFLAPLERRWKHVQAVGWLAKQVASVYGDEADTLVAAAYLHDVGYAPDLVATGFHPLDGARAVRRWGFPENVASLVAHHSMARVEATIRGLDRDLASEFPLPDSRLEDAVCYCDMATGPAGQPMAVEDRLNEIQARYGAEHVVTAFVEEARPAIIAAVRRTEERLAVAGVRVQGMPGAGTVSSR